MTKISLVLGGGGGRGAAHLGVLTALQESGLKPELVVGVSVGALVGAVFCAFPFAEATERLEAASGKVKIEMSKGKTTFPFFQTRRVFSEAYKKRLLEVDLGLAKVRFCDLHTPLWVTATALPCFKRVEMGGEENQSGIVDAVMASSATQRPYRWNGGLFLDGGICGNLPVRLAQERGSNHIFAVNLGFLFKRYSDWREYMPWRIVDYVGKQMVNRELQAARSAGAQIYEVYSPRVNAVSVYDYCGPEELRKEGYEISRRMLEEMERESFYRRNRQGKGKDRG